MAQEAKKDIEYTSKLHPDGEGGHYLVVRGYVRDADGDTLPFRTVPWEPLKLGTKGFSFLEVDGHFIERLSQIHELHRRVEEANEYLITREYRVTQE